MDALEKKFDEGIGKLDERIGIMKSELNIYVPPPRLNEIARRTYDDIGLELLNSNVGSSTAIGKNLRPKHWDVEGSNKLDPGTTNDMNEEKESIRGAGTNQAGDRFAYHGFEHRMRKLKMPVFEGEDAYGWIYRVERYFKIQGIPQQEQLQATALCMEGKALSWYRWSEGRTLFHSWDGFKRRLLIQFQQSKEGNLFTVMEATFTKGLKPALRAVVRVMNPEGLNHAMELAVSIEDNQLFEGVMQSKGVAAIVEKTTSKGDNFRCMTELGKLKDYVSEEPDLNFKSWDRGPKID
ncbi:hypothetical protein Tco_0213814 [Tanacetum coccineum]